MTQEKQSLDLNNLDHQLIVAAMANMAEKGMTPHQIFELLEDIKRQTFHSLAEIRRDAQ
ncbi:hypothetical protein MKY64_30365 [Paenibacillus sp. FSL R7-0210]|uniref:hypothetical protein n=1 Tax=Paenibacillus sp. FSL R7-0210 TaxID=2921676 RepID=UPI0030F4EE63